jgi:hypothetical protein
VIVTDQLPGTNRGRRPVRLAIAVRRRSQRSPHRTPTVPAAMSTTSRIRTA